MTTDRLKNMLLGSTITPATYEVSKSFLVLDHLIIFADDFPVLSVGPDDVESRAQADALLANSSFNRLVSTYLNRDINNMSYSTVRGSDLGKKFSINVGDSLVALASHTPGTFESGDSKGELIWVIPNNLPENEAFATALSIVKSITKIATS